MSVGSDPLAELATLGRALGGARWAQGAGGNVSVKTDDGELWVKASGTLLRDVATPRGHARASLALARRALEGDADAERELFARDPRPSLETYFHAMGPRVVAHVHGLGAMLYACSDAPYAARLKDGVTSIPYARPGRGVALAIAQVMGAEDEHVCVLRSHGVVAYARTAERAIALLAGYDAEARAGFAGLPAFEPKLEVYLAPEARPTEGGLYRVLPPRAPFETDPPLYLFPDAPVCATIVPVDPGAMDDPAAIVAEALATMNRACVVVEPGGRRAAVARTAAQLRQACEITAAHDWLEDALRGAGRAQYLPEDEPAALLDMPSEQYRIRLAARERG